MVRQRRDGLALPLLLLLLLALTALGHGVLLLTRGELQATWAFRHVVRAGQAAEIAARMGLRERMPFEEDRVRGIGVLLSSGESNDGLTFRSTLRWLDQEFFVLEAEGGSRGWRGERRLAWIGWSLHPEARLRAFLAASEVGGTVTLESGGVLDNTGFLASPEGWEEDLCEEYRMVLDSLFPSGSLPAVGSLNPADAVDTGTGTEIPPLGLLSGSLLLELAKESSSGSGSFSGPGFGGDLTGGCPPEERPVFYGTDGAVDLGQGELCGILVAEEDLRLGAEASFQGLALVGGSLLLEPGAVFEGMARVGERIEVGPGAELRSMACPVLWALVRHPELNRPMIVPGAGRLNGY